MCIFRFLASDGLFFVMDTIATPYNMKCIYKSSLNDINNGDILVYKTSLLTSLMKMPLQNAS
uniref:Uncharacterized protein n=1 Tax=Strigamia maritima TaxID=126957 RepID=T1IM22_STRMM